MAGEDKRREAVMLVVCGVLGVVAILLLAIGIDAQSESIGNTVAQIGKALQRSAPRPYRTPIERDPSPPVSPAAQPAVEPPVPHGPLTQGDATAWITSDDYPATALDKGLQGAVALELRIDPMGRVTDCVIAQSSGVGVLDEAACRTVRARGRFFPARDADGIATASIWRRRVVWRLPD